jgi:acetyltransferase-like isoleucine patch superfamily enzyme
MPVVREVLAFLRSIGQTDFVLPERSQAGDATLTGVQVDHEAGPGHLAWLSPGQAAKDPGRLPRFGGTLLIAPRDVSPAAQPPTGATVAPCRSPKLAFTRAVLEFFPELAVIRWPAAQGDFDGVGAILGRDVRLGPGAVLGSGVTLGDRVTIGPNTCIANAAIASDVSIGCNCTIGLSGFGFAKDEDGRYWRFPHIGRVVIEAGVEIGSNTCIDRGAIGDTVIRAGSKIDNLVHVAHNVMVERNALLIANCMIGGSTTIAEDAWIAPSAALMNQIRIGESAIVGLGAVVTKDVPAGAVVVGNPAKRLEKPA